MSVRLYVISDPPTIKFRQFVKDTNGTPFVVWQPTGGKNLQRDLYQKYILTAQTDTMKGTILRTLRLNLAL